MKRLSLLSVYVKDQDAAIEFYKKLGFIVAEDVPFGPQRWVTLRLADDEVVSLALKWRRRPKTRLWWESRVDRNLSSES